MLLGQHANILISTVAIWGFAAHAGSHQCFVFWYLNSSDPGNFNVSKSIFTT